MRITREVLRLPRAAAPDEEVFAIGDIHGRADLLDALLNEADREPRRAATRAFVFTGDLIDRGPHSLKALQLAQAVRDSADTAVGLMGNHEILARLALDPATPESDAEEAFELWLRNGGVVVMAELFGDSALDRAASRIFRDLRARPPESLARHFTNLVSHWRTGDVLFVHAGLNPTLPLEDTLRIPWNVPVDQIDERTHWAWVRGPFLDHRPGPKGFSGWFVVHGHTPQDKGHTSGHAEQVRRFRLNIDGGSAMTGMAKMAILRGDLAEIVTARAR